MTKREFLLTISDLYNINQILSDENKENYKLGDN